jgi:N-acetyl-gamma-glutamyl-phosphate reductase
LDKQIRTGIVGATGYVGLELIRGLHSHPIFRLSTLSSQSFTGKYFSDIYPAFRNIVDLPLTKPDIQQLKENCDLVITALPHGVSSSMVPLLLKQGLRVLDHSGDFRYRDVAVYEQAYGIKHPSPETVSQAVYGLPEIYRNRLRDTTLISNPGCYPTCSILAIKPLLDHHLIHPSSLIINAVSGVSGAGRKSDLAFSFCETDQAFKAYSPTGHRHTSEIEQILSDISGVSVKISFTPHLAPVKRGMYATIYADLQKNCHAGDLRQLYIDTYRDEYFVRIMPSGLCPDTKNVLYTNFADLSVFVDERTQRVVILCAIDNLGKGAALQAVQSLNCMYGLPETTGLIQTGGGI